MSRIKWPIRYRFWRAVHGIFNKLAWKYANPGGEEWGRALRIDRTKLLWRLNEWSANKYTGWYIERIMGRNKV